MTSLLRCLGQLGPFCGGGTTAAVCIALGRHFLTFDTDPASIEMARQRLAWNDLPLFAKHEVFVSGASS